VCSRRHASFRRRIGRELEEHDPETCPVTNTPNLKDYLFTGRYSWVAGHLDEAAERLSAIAECRLGRGQVSPAAAVIAPLVGREQQRQLTGRQTYSVPRALASIPIGMGNPRRTTVRMSRLRPSPVQTILRPRSRPSCIADRSTTLTPPNGISVADDGNNLTRAPAG